MKDTTPTIEDVVDAITNIQIKLDVMADLQMLLVQEVGENNHRFQNNAVKKLLSKKIIRDDFTNWLFSKENIPDDIKTALIEINEAMLEREEE